MRFTFLLLLLLPVFAHLFAQSDDRIAKGTLPLYKVPMEVVPYMDNEELLEAELARREPGIAPKFAQKITTYITPELDGKWEVLANGRAVWRQHIYSANAKSLNLGFTKYVMPKGGSLILYSPDHKRIIGPFTPADNEEHEQLWTPILEGEELIIEVQLPQRKIAQLELVLRYINHDFLGFGQLASGACNLDVACSEADGWGIVDHYRDIIRSVANIGVEGDSYCSGFLINNTRNDQTPYFMTADHCGFTLFNAPTLVAYWNYESSVCRPPNSTQSGIPGNGNFNTFSTGAHFRAAYAPTDFTLLELDDPVPVAAAAFMAGWNIEDIAPMDTMICIHHPRNDEKRISFEFDPTYYSEWGRDGDYVPDGNHLIVPDWDIGTTEGGSSGSPLFNSNKEVVGQLHGGYAACGNDEYDSYGRFYSSWEGGGTPETRLKDWLNPDNLNVTSWPGRDLYSEIFALQPSREVCLPAEVAYTLQIGTGFTAEVDLTLPNFPVEAGASFSNNPVMPGTTTQLTITNPDVLSSGFQTITVEGTDGNNNKSIDLYLTLFSEIPALANLEEPANDALDTPPSPVYSWATPQTGMTYDIEVATDTGFTFIVDQATGISGNTYAGSALESLTEYFWKVRANNTCGEGEWSLVNKFTTSIVVCGLGNVVSNTPVVISGNGTPTISSTLTVTESLNIASLKLRDLTIAHSWVGDLQATLESPKGTIVNLFTTPDDGGCEYDDIAVTFDDAATNTYEDFDNTCNASGTAIAGTFQAEESLAAFAGEDAQGVWTLRIIDHVDQDGGALQKWTLDFCGTFPAVAGVFPESDILEACPGETASIKVQTGTGYQGPVTLALSGLPPGAISNISPNPVNPGGFATIEIDGLQNIGDYPVEVSGTNMGEVGTKDFMISVIDNPGAFATINPVANSVDVEASIELSWEASPEADIYCLTLRRDSIDGPLAFTEELTETTYSAFLGGGNTYFWEVVAKNNCGELKAEGGIFRTEGPLTFNALPAIISMCKDREADIEINIGSGFLNPVSLTYVIQPMADFVITYDVDPSNAESGSQVMVSLEAGSGVAPGFYDIWFNAEDNLHSAQTMLSLEVKDVPSPAVLESPVDGSSEVTTLPVFTWEDLPDISFYAFQLARDEEFTDLVLSTSASENSLSLSNPLPASSTYFWRVYAYNSCGNTVSATASFSTLLTGVHDLQDLEVSIHPNPADQEIQVNFSQGQGETMQLQLFSADGRMLVDDTLEKGILNYPITVASYPNGIYFIRLLKGESAINERIIVQH